MLYELDQANECWEREVEVRRVAYRSIWNIKEQQQEWVKEVQLGKVKLEGFRARRVCNLLGEVQDG